MATLLPPKSKRQKLIEKNAVVEEVPNDVGNVVAQFKSVDGAQSGPSLTVPANVTTEQLTLLVNEILKTEEDEQTPYSFAVELKSKKETNTVALDGSLWDVISRYKKSTEDVFTIIYRPEAVFRVRPVTRCSSALQGHSEPILCAEFSPDGSSLATGSGDMTVRLWDLNTETPHHTLSGHGGWVLCVAWSPNGRMVASGSADGRIRLWDARTGKEAGELRGHTKWIMSLAWEPLHSNAKANRLVSASKDGTVRVWDVLMRKCEFTMSSHNASVNMVKWGGEGLIYSASSDKTIKVWDGKSGKLVRTLAEHAHWVNALALSTDFILRTGAFDHTGKRPANDEQAHEWALKRYREFIKTNPERLMSASDDFTLFLWDPVNSKKSIARLTGHQKLVNHVTFSPSSHMVASASFDNSIKVWDGRTGKFLMSLRGHVGPVYRCAWSSDSRMLITASKDSTLKIWDLKTAKIKLDLPGHTEDVYCVDWSPGGDKVVSGGKDRLLRIWKH